MSLGNIIGNMLRQGTPSQGQNRLRTGAENAERSGGGIEQMLGSLMGGSGASGTGGGDLAQRARDSSARSRPVA